MSVSPSTKSLVTGASATFSATVTGASNTSVTWSVREGAAGGTVTANGNSATYVAPNTAGTYHVVATSAADASKSDAATVQVTAPTAPPAAPANLTASGGCKAVTLLWSDVSTASSYTVKRDTSAGGTFSKTLTATAALTSSGWQLVDTLIATSKGEVVYLNHEADTAGTPYHYLSLAKSCLAQLSPADMVDGIAVTVTCPGNAAMTAPAATGSVSVNWARSQYANLAAQAAPAGITAVAGTQVFEVDAIPDPSKYRASGVNCANPTLASLELDSATTGVTETMSFNNLVKLYQLVANAPGCATVFQSAGSISTLGSQTTVVFPPARLTTGGTYVALIRAFWMPDDTTPLQKPAQYYDSLRFAGSFKVSSSFVY